MEDMKYKHKPFQNGSHHIGLEYSIPQNHSPYHVYPYPSPVRLQHAFHVSGQIQAKCAPKTFLENNGGHYLTPTDSPILGRVCFTPRESPQNGRFSRLSDKMDNMTITSETDALVAKIGAMFPTVSETHIRLLLKKYYNREAVVISALQVEKHPITTPGPVTSSPTISRLQRSAMGVYSALQLSKGISGSSITPLTGTPHGSPSLIRPGSCASSYSPRSIDGHPIPPKPHSSPKMKLRYLKSVFPKAEVTLILDVLANKDNQVQKASEELLSMGYAKKEPSVIQPKPKEVTPQPPKKIIVKTKSAEEKDELSVKLKSKYSTVPEKVVAIALESVDFNEERAEQILTAVVQEDLIKKPKPVTETVTVRVNETVVDEKLVEKSISVQQSVEGKENVERDYAEVQTNIKDTQEQQKRSVFRRLKLKNDKKTKSPPLVASNNFEKSYQSPYAVATKGPNPHLRQGPNDNLLLEDYLIWNGPNPELRTGRQIVPEGADGKTQPHKSTALGHNHSLVKGPAGIAKGSIYKKITKSPLEVVIR